MHVKLLATFHRTVILPAEVRELMCRTPQRQSQRISRRSLRLHLLMFLGMGLSQSLLCGAQDGPSSNLLHLHGSVVNGLTGKPIARALVVSADQRVATMTDTEGHFAIDLTLRENTGSMYGGLALTPRKPGFSQNLQPTMVPLDAASATTNLELKLMPVASISGQVFSSNDEPAGEVTVSLFERQVEEGQQVWRQRNGTRTNSHGEFHFSSLEPGEYTVLTAEWRGDQPLPLPQQQQHKVTTQYPPDYAGDTSSFDAATKLHLHFGDATHLELHLRAALYYPVNIPVAGSLAGVFVRVSWAGAAGGPANFNGFALGYNNRDHAVEGSLPAGDYTLLLSQRAETPSFANIPLHIANAPFDGAPVALAPGISIPVRVEKQFTQTDTSSNRGEVTGIVGGRQQQAIAQLFLRPVDEGGQTINSRPSAEEGVELDGVPPGQYTVRAFAFRGYVASMSSGGVDLLHHPLVITAESRPEPIDLVLRDDTGSVSGTLNTENNPRPLPPVTFLALIPEAGAGVFTQGVATQDGKFQIPNVAPGSYRVLAFRGNFQQIAYRDPKSLEAWEWQGSHRDGDARRDSSRRCSHTRRSRSTTGVEKSYEAASTFPNLLRGARRLRAHCSGTAAGDGAARFFKGAAAAGRGPSA